MTHRALRERVYAYYREHGRHALPWRKTNDPYKIFVSEVMLQQTQVDRVIPYYRAFLKRFPNVRALAAAPLRDVLMLWQGLGYNRRAKLMHAAAQEIVSRHAGRFPKTEAELVALPGIGPYTARAILAFAYNADVVLVETNVRTVLIHHLYPKDEPVTDAELLKTLAALSPQGDARAWYAALMDYGSFLKRSGVRTNARSAHYTKQKAFKGSTRQLRGAILRALAGGASTKKALLQGIPSDRYGEASTQLDALMAEGLVERRGRRYSLPD